MVFKAGIRMIHRLSGIHIGTDHIKFRRIAPEGFKIKGVQLQRNLVIAKFGIEQIPRLQKGTPAAVSLVPAEPGIVAKDPPDLPRLVVASEGRSGRNADDPVKSYAPLHQNIHHPGAEQPPHGAALQNQPFFHIRFLFSLQR